MSLYCFQLRILQKGLENNHSIQLFMNQGCIQYMVKCVATETQTTETVICPLTGGEDSSDDSAPLRTSDGLQLD